MIENNQNLRSSEIGQNFDRTQAWIEKTGSEQVSNIQISLPNQTAGFYGEESFTFSNCRRNGMHGPDLATCIAFYNVDWVKNPNYFSIWQTKKSPKRSKNGIQKVKIPVSAEYELIAFGAGCVNHGAMAKSNVHLEIGTELFIGIGQRRTTISDGCGGTFVAIRENGQFIPIIIAGGAGGARKGNMGNYGNGSLDQFGNKSSSINERNQNIGKAGKSGYPWCYTGGNGFFGRVKGNWEFTEETPKSFEDGLNGAKSLNGDEYWEGGFGGRVGKL